jgi:capsular exopolysaccharide synthesis family protein
MNKLTSSPSDYTPPYSSQFDEESIDLKRYISLFISNWYWFAIVLFVALGIAYSINRWSEKVYTVSSSLLIKDDQFGGVNAGLTNIFPGTESFNSQQKLTNEIGILKSLKLNYKAIQELKEFPVEYIGIGRRNIVELRMYVNCPFIVVYDSLEKQTFGQKVSIKIISDKKYKLEINGKRKISKEMTFSEKFVVPGYDFKIELRDNKNFEFDPDESNKYYFYFNDLYELANQYRNKLSVQPIEENASMVILSVSGYAPDQEADYLNTLMNVYIRDGLDFKNKTAGQSINFIEDQLALISDSLHVAEGNLENFRLVNKLIDISKEGSLIQTKLEQIDNEKSSLLLQESYYRYLKGYIDSKTENEDIVAPSVVGVTDQLLVRLVDELSNQQQQKKQLAMNLKEPAEPLKIIEANLIATRSALAENIISGLQNIERSKDNIEERLTRAEMEVRKLPSTERQLISIQRKFDINNTIYTFLLEKRAEAGIAKASNVPDNRVIDNAGYFSSTMIRPKNKRNILLAFLLGLFVPGLCIILIDYLNNKIIDKKDIEKGTNAPILGFISHNNLKTEMPVVKNPGSTLSESFRSVRTNLKYFVKDARCPVISISSTISTEGKTFISVNLAAILAMSGKKVLLIGLDLRKPRIHRIFNLKNETGLTNFLIGEAKYEDVIAKTEVENLWFAQSGPVPPNPAELIESAEMTVFITRAKKEFDYIVIDTPPVALVTDALLISPLTDFYIFVIRQRYSSKNTLGLVEELHKNDNIKSLGIVVNDISISGYYGYGLRYGYSLGYGYNYGYNYYSQYGKYGYSDSAKGYYKEDA